MRTCLCINGENLIMEYSNYWCEYKECILQFNEEGELLMNPIQKYLGDCHFILDTQCTPTPEFPKWVEEIFNPNYRLSPEEFKVKFANYSDILYLD